MSRKSPTKEELVAGQALVDYLVSQNCAVSDVDFDDKPDLRYRLNRRLVGCELVSFIPEKMQQAVRVFAEHMYKKDVKFAQVVIPAEPEQWIKRAIENKWALAQGYERNAFTQNLSLLLHYSMIGAKDPIDYDQQQFVDGVAYGEWISLHGFKNVYYFSGTRIYRLSSDKRNVPPREIKLKGGYPCYAMWVGTGTMDELQELWVEPKGLTLPADHVFVVPPMTPEYKNVKPSLPQDLKITVKLPWSV